jgi:hypothetical protein
MEYIESIMNFIYEIPTFFYSKKEEPVCINYKFTGSVYIDKEVEDLIKEVQNEIQAEKFEKEYKILERRYEKLSREIEEEKVLETEEENEEENEDEDDNDHNHNNSNGMIAILA